MNRIPVGLIGCSSWGTNLIGDLSSCPYTDVVAVCDTSSAQLEQVAQAYPGLGRVFSVNDFLKLPVDAAVVATPLPTRFELARRCLEAGMHVLIEKPLASTTTEAEELTALAHRLKRVLMVGHPYLFQDSIHRIRDILDNGELGEPYYIDIVRTKPGRFRQDINVIGELAPDDLAMIDLLIRRPARSISACGCAHRQPGVEDVAYVNIDYGKGLMANFHLSWLSPVTTRRTIIAGTRRSLTFDELDPIQPVRLYDRGIELPATAQERYRQLIGTANGTAGSRRNIAEESRQGLVTKFAESILHGEPPVSDGRLGTRVVRILEAATRSLRAQGGRVVLSPDSLPRSTPCPTVHRPMTPAALTPQFNSVSG